MTMRFEATTRGIRVTAEPTYLSEQSDPEAPRHVWAYHITIENHGDSQVQLLTRHWKITDATGHVHEVKGDGVVGEQPVLDPGDSFEYTSGTPLRTSSGFMQGSYMMRDASGEYFDITVPTFSLDLPQPRTALH